MPDEFLNRLRQFHDDAFPQHESTFQNLVDTGQHPNTLFIGCCDSRIVPHWLTGSGPGDLFLVRNVGAFVPPYDGYVRAPQTSVTTAPPDHWVGYHGTAAAIEFAVLNLKVSHIIVCGHSHCGGIQALYDEPPAQAVNLAHWLELGREAALPVAEPGVDVLRRTEQRAVILQLERLMAYPMVRDGVEAGQLALHGWHYVIEDGEVHVFDVKRGAFVAASVAENAGTGPYQEYDEPPQPPASAG